MKKIRLDAESLRVESFATDALAGGARNRARQGSHHPRHAVLQLRLVRGGLQLHPQPVLLHRGAELPLQLSR